MRQHTLLKYSQFLFLLCHILFLQYSDSFLIRQATENDVSIARKILFQQAMNPFSISTQTMLVACDKNNNVLGFGQIRPLDDQFSELASLFVLPEYRNQGIGSDLVSALLNRHKATNKQQSKVCLLTLKPTSGFYKSFGFYETNNEVRKRLPRTIQLEFQAGNLLSFALGNTLVCMIQRE